MNRAQRRAQVKYFMHKMHVSKSVAESMIGEGKESEKIESVEEVSKEETKVEE